MRMLRWSARSILGVGLLLICATASAQVDIGASAPDFTLTDIRGEAVSLSAYAGKTVVLEWTNYDCPFVKKHYSGGHMQALQSEAAGRGVVWLSVNSSAAGKQGHFTPEQWLARSSEAGVASEKILLDPSGEVGRAYGAKTTPHLFIVDPKGKVVYQGAIDDRPTTNAEDIAGAKNYVRQALDELEAGKPVSEPVTAAYGCSVKY